MSSKSLWLIIVFGGYVVSVLIFAGIYFWLYRKDRRNFGFNADIFASQLDETKTRTKKVLDDLRGQMEVFHELCTALDSQKCKIEYSSEEERFGLSFEDTSGAEITLPSGAKVIFEKTSGMVATGSQTINLGDSVYRLVAPDGTLIGKGDFPSQHPLTNCKDIASSILFELQKGVARHEKRLAMAGEIPPDIWSYWDFVYFSTIVQTTVGFGDILPNTTTVRQVVVAQILGGVVLLVLVLNLILAT